MSRLLDLERRILEKIKPKPHEYELLFKTYEIVKERIEEFFKERGVYVEASLQGSVAHDTWLSGDRDLDIFVLFPKKVSINDLKTKYFQLLVEVVSELGEYELRYAEHPYVHVKVNDVDIDVVPAYKLDSPKEIKTAVDRTPFHTRYLNSRLDSELCDHVRLLKQFMKNIGVYGAEVKTKGFSGYVVELLVIIYGGFREALRNISRWKPPVYINSLGDEESFKKVVKVLRKKYPDSIIYLPDPVDPLRNAAANVSIESLAKIVVASTCYMKKPSEKFFFTSIETVDLHRFLDNRCIVLLELNIQEKLPPDTLWGELLRIADRIVKVLRNHDFNVIDYSVWSDEVLRAYIALELDVCEKKYPRLYRGPEFWINERVLDYIRKHIIRGSIGPWITRSGELLALGVRRYSSVDQVLKDRVWEYMVAPHFKNVKPKIYVIDLNSISKLGLNGEVGRWLQRFIVKRPHWIEECIE